MPSTANDTGLDFVGCSFENGTCGWEDKSLGQSQWARGRNASGNLGPTTDHTVGTEFGEATVSKISATLDWCTFSLGL